jgi:hypothetical protein
VGYFLKAEDGEKGPFSLKQLKAAMKDGNVAPTAEIRQEGQLEFSPLDSVLRRRRKQTRRRTKGTQDPERRVGKEAESASKHDDETETEADGEGSFLLGLLAGLIGSVLVLLLVLRRAKPATRQGVWVGAAIQLAYLLLRR